MPNSSRKIIRGYKALSKKLDGRSRVQIWRDIKAGALPAPFLLGPNSVAWFDDEIDREIESRARRMYGHKTEAEATEAD